jgi:hypothetical protein
MIVPLRGHLRVFVPADVKEFMFVRIGNARSNVVES